MLALLDTFYPPQHQRRKRTVANRLRYYSRRFLDKHDGLAARFKASQYLHRVYQPGASKISAFAAGWRSVAYFVRGQLSGRRVGAFVPRSYPGSVTLFEAEQAPIPGGARAGWEQSVAGTLEVIPVPGAHHSMLEEEGGLTLIAEVLQRYLQNARTDRHSAAAARSRSFTVSQAFLKRSQIIGRTRDFDEGVVVYGIEPDHWIQTEALIRLDCTSTETTLVLDIESHAPAASHPITLTLQGTSGNSIAVHTIDAPGVSELRCDLSEPVLHGGHAEIWLRCDRTFVPCQVQADNSDRRQLGVRLLAAAARHHSRQ